MIREAKGNMYEFVSHTWNPIKGKCYHGCSYCYMDKLSPKRGEARLDAGELANACLGSGNFIFVGSSIDMFAQVKGKKGGSSKENLINKKLNELWDSFNVSVESAE